MRAFTISSGGDRNLADRLGLTSVARSDEADLVIISGSEAEQIELEVYRRQLAPAAQTRLSVSAPIPIFTSLPTARLFTGAGAIARIYNDLGGMVHWIGKPHREIYEFAIARWNSADPAKIVCIGDSIEHDIKGATDMALSSVLVRTGILADASEEELSELTRHFAADPTYIMPGFSNGGSGRQRAPAI